MPQRRWACRTGTRSTCPPSTRTRTGIFRATRISTGAAKTFNVLAYGLTWYKDAAHNRTVIQMDNNGDATADMMIVIAGTALNLVRDDFFGLNGI